MNATPSSALGLWQVANSAQSEALVRYVRQTGKSILHVMPQDKDVHAAEALCRFLAPEIEILVLPAWDTLPYDRVSPAFSIQSQRLKTLGKLAHKNNIPLEEKSLVQRNPSLRATNGSVAIQENNSHWIATSPTAPRDDGQNAYILLTTLNAISQYLPPRSVIQKASFSIHPGTTLAYDALTHFLGNYGYSRTGKVMEAGEYAVRGSIIDLFPAGADEAIRIDLFGDEVESLRRFDPLTQLSGETVQELTLIPVSEVMLNATSISHFREQYLALFGAVTREDPLYASVSEGRPHPGMEHWLPLFYTQLDTLADYTPEAAFSIDQRIPALHAERSEAIADYYGARQLHAKQRTENAPYYPIAPESLFLDSAALERAFHDRPHITMTPFVAEGGLDLQLKSSPQIYHRRHEEQKSAAETAIAFLQSASKPIVIVASSPGSADRLHKILQLESRVSLIHTFADPLKSSSPLEGEPKSAKRDSVGGDNTTTSPPTKTPKRFDSPSRGELALAVLPIDHGYETADYLLLTEQDLFGEKVIRTTTKRKKSDAFMAEAASFAEGEIIVHREHGIGRYDGLVTVEVGSTKHDCLKLIYDGGDKLFLPVENIDLISRYGTSEENVTLDKLGGVAWQKRKSALKKRLKMAAEALIKVAAERAAKLAPSFAPAAGIYDEFVARFPYSETEDQLQAIEDVRGDLAAGRAMDRLICGDVGFGKTEVAMRAAFIAAASGAQVAIIAPTTLLARQHFHNFTHRFEGLPLSIRMLSRLTIAKDVKDTKEKLAEGKIDIVIGTHALLSQSVQFKQLGLLIVDEEQHFGVAQKEKLKALKTDIHVLTLSATPIPRTLQMALSGVRELSLITTPPIDRLAVRTYVMPTDPVILREALLREYHRGGKSFYVTPRVKYMAELQQQLRELVPELKVAVAHGQMAATQLDKVMNEFYDGKYDVLLSTAIIESGIDIPTANTMIIDRAHLFGLSQLYQLRGRVGRSKTRAYAYFTLPHHKLLSAHAQRRLEVMQQLDSLGAGFQLASHDMDIRGFGNLLGEEQSGHIKEVGIELYQAMLEETIADMRRKKQPGTAAEAEPTHDWSPQINLGTSVLIPETYIEDLALRLSLYRRAAALETQDALESFAAELIDRFGKLPQEVEHLLAILQIKIICKIGGIARLDAGPKGIVLAFRDNQFAAPEKLIAHIAKNANRIKLRADQTLFIAQDCSVEAARMNAASSIAQEIAGLLASTHPQAA